MELSDEILTEISYVQLSKYRIKVMKALEGDVKIPSGIAKDSGIKINHISKVLAELKAHQLVECINPEVRKGRLYRLTDKGEKVSKNLADCSEDI
ncbi:transcriptional regulator [Methanobrevibacter sp.]|jgi:DNA-binding MarR family transcriptional regulator